MTALHLAYLILILMGLGYCYKLVSELWDVYGILGNLETTRTNYWTFAIGSNLVWASNILVFTIMFTTVAVESYILPLASNVVISKSVMAENITNFVFVWMFLIIWVHLGVFLVEFLVRQKATENDIPISMFTDRVIYHNLIWFIAIGSIFLVTQLLDIG